MLVRMAKSFCCSVCAQLDPPVLKILTMHGADNENVCASCRADISGHDSLNRSIAVHLKRSKVAAMALAYHFDVCEKNDLECHCFVQDEHGRCFLKFYYPVTDSHDEMRIVLMDPQEIFVEQRPAGDAQPASTVVRASVHRISSGAKGGDAFAYSVCHGIDCVKLIGNTPQPFFCTYKCAFLHFLPLLHPLRNILAPKSAKSALAFQFPPLPAPSAASVSEILLEQGFITQHAPVVFAVKGPFTYPTPASLKDPALRQNLTGSVSIQLWRQKGTPEASLRDFQKLLGHATPFPTTGEIILHGLKGITTHLPMIHGSKQTGLQVWGFRTDDFGRAPSEFATLQEYCKYLVHIFFGFGTYRWMRGLTKEAFPQTMPGISIVFFDRVDEIFPANQELILKDELGNPWLLALLNKKASNEIPEAATNIMFRGKSTKIVFADGKTSMARIRAEEELMREHNEIGTYMPFLFNGGIARVLDTVNTAIFDSAHFSDQRDWENWADPKNMFAFSTGDQNMIQRRAADWKKKLRLLSVPRYVMTMQFTAESAVVVSGVSANCP